MKCQKCPKEAIIHIPYRMESLCEEHFQEFFTKRVRRICRLNQFFQKGEKIGAAVSGGKDSVVTLRMMKEIMPRNEIVGISIDEGIEGYRDKAIKKAIENYKELEIEYKIVKLKKEIGNSIEEIVQKTKEQNWKENSCTFCGVFRRKYINQTAHELGCDKLATGHNLDDEAQSICMNLFSNNIERMKRTGPRIQFERIKGFIQRVKPLYDSPEEEVELFANLKQYPHYNETCCPFSQGAKRNHYRLMLDQMEAKMPGTKQNIVQSFIQMKPFLKEIKKQKPLKECPNCGELTSQNICQACQFQKRIQKTKIREKISTIQKPSHTPFIPITNGPVV